MWNIQIEHSQAERVSGKLPPRLRLGFGLGLVLELGSRGNFPRGQNTCFKERSNMAVTPNFWVTISSYKKECLPVITRNKKHRRKLYPWYTQLGKTFLQLLLFKTFLFRQSEKVSSILWSVWVFFAFLEKRKPNR